MARPIRRILVIDDDADALQILTDYLELEGYEVLPTADGATGMQLLASQPVELVITDLNLPGISGMDVIDIIRKNYPRVQVIVVTGYGSMESVLQALHKGAIDYLTKPFLFEILKLSLQKAEQQLVMNAQLERLRREGPGGGRETLLEALPLACAFCDPEGRLVQVNSAFLDLFELDQAPLGPLADQLDTEAAQQFQRFIHDFKDGSSLVLQLKHGPRPRLLELNLLGSAGGESSQRLLVAETILEDESRGDNHELECLLVASNHGTVLWGNEASVDFLGLDPDSPEDLHLTDLFPGEPGRRLGEIFDGLPALTQCHVWRTRIASLNGVEREMQVRVTPLIDDHHRRKAICISLQEIRPLSGSGEYYRRRAVGHAVPLLYLDSEQRVAEMSPALQKIFGRGASDCPGKPLSEVLKFRDKDGGRLRGNLLTARGPMPMLARGLRERNRHFSVLELAPDTDGMPLEESIEEQRQRLEQASHLLMELRRGEGHSTAVEQSLNARMSRLVQTAGALSGVNTALLALGSASGQSCHLVWDRPEPWQSRPELANENRQGTLASLLELLGHAGGTSAANVETRLGRGSVLAVRGTGDVILGALFLAHDGPLAEPVTELLCQSLESLGLYYVELELNRHVRRTEEKFRQLYDKARFAVFVIDLEEAVILEANQAACELTGFSPEELVGRRIWDLRPPDFREIARRNWLSSISQSGETRFEGVPLLRKDGKLIYVEYDNLLTELQGRRVIQSFYRDITEKQAMEFTLNQSQKLAGLGQLSAGIAHELRNPLGIINSSLYFINSTLRGERLEGNAQLQKHLGIIQSEVERARRIIENLLSFSRVSKYEKEPVDLVELLNQTLDLVKKELLVNNIRLETELEPLPHVGLNLDEMKQALLNIIINATQAMPDGGTLMIRTRSGNGRILLHFRDTGVGIRKEDLPNVLNPFFTTKDPGQGTGLGLSLTHTIIQRSGGGLKIESEVGRGTEVTIELPC
ncbi:MAG: PAS domain S-box protein [Calditrichaeota bacterium]|nr:PAS domain S-box protein [Calditrichota bacterium]